MAFRGGKRWRCVAAAGIVLLAALGFSPVGADHRIPPDPGAVPGQLVVKFAPGTTAAQRRSEHSRAGSRLVRHLLIEGYDLVAVSGGEIAGAAHAYERSPRIAGVQPNYLVRIAMTPNDPCFVPTTVCDFNPGQWSLYAIAAQLGWDVVPGRTYTAAEKKALTPIKVAVIDSPIDTGHPDFANAGNPSTDVLDGGQLDLAHARSWLLPGQDGPGPASYHGTYVAGIIAAATHNATNVASLGYRAEILPLAVVQSTGNSDAASLAEAITYGHDQGARVINLSLGLLAESQIVHDAIIGVTSDPVSPSLVVAAAGNNTGSADFFPGSYPEVMSVTGFDVTYSHAACANYNGNVSVAAPAAGVISLFPRSEGTVGGSKLCGTSAAAPHVSALAVLLMAQATGRTPAQVRDIIEKTAEDMGDPGKDPMFGWGEINVDKALRYGAGPVVSGINATVAGKNNRSTTITATVTSSAPITAAEAYVDRPGDPAMRVGLEPADGTWGGVAEQVQAVMTLPGNFPVGKRRLFVRAADAADGWGPVYTGWLLVDLKGPTISNLSASNVYRPLQQGASRISFALADDWSPVFAYTVEARTDDGKIVLWESRESGVGPGYRFLSWVPEPGHRPGFYRVVVTALDGVGNSATASVRILVL